ADALDGYVPDFDATTVTRVLAAGGTVIGKNTMNGLAGGKAYGGATGDYGRPLNPHDPDHMTGGSSSGSRAALAAGEVDISCGGGQGGSTRIPAAWCGAVARKPPLGLVCRLGVGFGSEPSIDYTGPMARHTEDVARPPGRRRRRRPRPPPGPHRPRRHRRPHPPPRRRRGPPHRRHRRELRRSHRARRERR